MTLVVLGGGCARQVATEAIGPAPSSASAPHADANDDTLGMEFARGPFGEAPATPPPPPDAFDPSSDAGWTAVAGDPGPTPGDPSSPPAPRSDARGGDAGTVDAASPPDLALRPPTGPSDLSRGRLGHWRFDEIGGTGVADSGPFGNHGATIGIVEEDWKPARLNNGLSFTPAHRSFVLVGAHQSLNPPRTLSIALWAFARSWEGRPCLLEKGDPDEQYGLTVRAGRLEFYVRLQEGRIARVSTPVPPQSQWVHIAAIYDGQGAFLFVDGALIAATPAPGHPMGALHNLTIGGRSPGSTDGGFFTGLLDEVLLYARPLSAEEVGLLATGKGP